MAESARLVDLVQEALEDFLGARSRELVQISPELGALGESARGLLGTGKRFRALFCYWGWQSVAGRSGSDPLLAPAPDAAPDAGLDTVVHVAGALELFHAAALVHDDIIDNSDTRRGGPSMHRRFEEQHRTSDWAGDAAAFGTSAAMILGDLLLSWSEEAFDGALHRLTGTAAAAARAEFNRMRTEVMLGQYLDILDEQSWRMHAEQELLARAHRVIVYKSAKYSVEAPLLIGAALAGAGEDARRALSAFGLPLGIAYQLRDDLLGVFGDPALTGKPSGDDLREGKRTVLVALARTRLPSHARRFLDELLGDRELEEDQVRMLQAAIRDSGAVEEVERLIQHHLSLATEAIAQAPVTASARDELLRLAESVTRRSA